MPNPFEHFLLFLYSVGDHTFTLLAGCLVTVVIAIIEKRVLKRPMSVKTEVAILTLFVFFACFQAWRDQYKAQESATKKAEELSIPNFSGKIDLLGLSPTGQKGIAKSCSIIVVATIKNSGAPSIAENYSAVLVTPTSTITGNLVVRSDVNFTLQGKKEFVGRFRAEDLLPQKTANIPIVRGGAATGFLAMVFRGLTDEEIYALKPTFQLRFNDINGKAYHLDWPIEKTAINDRFISPNDLVTPK